MDVKYMTDLLEEALDRHDKVDEEHFSNIHLGIRWWIIPLGTRGLMLEEDKVRALHIECAKEHAAVVKEVFSDIYSANAKKFPSGIKLRFVPDIFTVVSQNTKAKVLHLRARQARFLKNVREMTSYEIASLDRCFRDRDSLEASIREWLMALKLTERDYLLQFVNVAPQFNSTGVVFMFIPQLESEARSMVASIIPYFRYRYGDEIARIFKPDAWELHSETYWDPYLKEAITPDDEKVEQIAEMDLEYNWEELEDRTNEKEAKREEEG
jgi:hypothetical protein